MNNNIISIINEHYHSFSNSNKHIADYITNNINHIAFNTLENLASNIGVSTATIIRFAQLLGYNGYSEMLKDIQNVLITKISLPDRLDATMPSLNSGNELLSDTFNSEIQNIQSTLNILSNNDVSNALNTIINGNTLYILGLRGAFSLALYAFARFSQVRRNTRLVDAPAMLLPENIIDAEKGDVCLAFSFPRYSRHATQILKELRKKSVKIIIITGENTLPLSNDGDIVLPCYITSKTIKNSYVAPLCLVNYLFNGIIMSNTKSSKDVLNDMERFLSEGFFLEK